MKPYQLIEALMHAEGIGALPLAKKLGKASLQSQIYRFSKGEVASPERTTAVPLAAYFKIPVDAIYDEKVATAVAAERGLSVVPPKTTVKKERGGSAGPAKDSALPGLAKAVANLKTLAQLNPQTYERVLAEVARITDGALAAHQLLREHGVTSYVKPERAAEVLGLPDSPDLPPANDRNLGGISGFADLDDEVPAVKGGKR